MLESIRKITTGWLAKLILALITIPFALFGIESYLSQAGSGAAVAKVDGDAITIQEFGNALQNMRNRLQSEGKVDASLLDSPELKQSVLNRLVNEHLLNKEVRRAKFAISNESLGKTILAMPEFQEKGQFSQELYDKILAQNQLSPSKFESRMRTELLAQQAREGVASFAYQPRGVAEQVLRVEHQQREIQLAEIKVSDYLSQVKIDPAQLKDYYEKNKDKFRIPEQVKLEFVLMSANTLIANMKVSDEETKKYYDENAGKFQGDEKRKAAHILISFGVGATAQDKENARKKAEDVLVQVKKDPKKFAELAKKYSQDPGSAANGGELPPFGRGEMVKPFEDAAFAMTAGSVSDLVESEFGYHIIKLIDIEGQAQGYDSMKPQIRAELMYQKALAKFSEQAESFSNMVYEQSGSLEPASKEFGLQVQTSGWLSKEDGAKFFKNDKLMNMVFSDEVLKERRNTEAVEVGPNNLVSARVVDYKPAAPRSFEEVRDGIEAFLKSQQASKLTAQKGEAALAELRAGKQPAGVAWAEPVIIDRKNPHDVTPQVMSEVFKLDVSKLPTYAGIVDGSKGYKLIKLNRVDLALPEDESNRKSAEFELQNALESEYVAAYLKSLKDKSKVALNQKLLLGEGSGN